MVERIHKNVLSWAKDLDKNTLQQAVASSELPFVKRPIALMADAHLGYGATVGSVIATKSAIIPSAVGVDIGCGMVAAKASVEDLPDDLSVWHEKISAAIPAGMPKNRRSKSGTRLDDLDTDKLAQLIYSAPDVLYSNLDRVAKQFGTLGSGNHFVELCTDENKDVWLVLHSGSRGAGKKIADHHIAKAKGLMKKYFVEVEPELSYLVADTPEFDAYISDMLWAQEYAMASREAMVDEVFKAVPELGVATEVINCHHNYCAMEHHHNHNVWVTRKGAIRAREGDMGVIPGSMATGSYIVSGRGSKSAYNSASHGAGRKMSRTQARKTLTTESLDKAMGGIAWNDDSEGLLDEHPGAYKDIESVMEAQKDLVRVVHKLDTVLNYKGN